MMTWRVRLKGHDFDLSELADRLGSSGLAVEKADDGHYLTSTEFEAMAESRDVLRRAQGIVAVLNGALRARVSGYQPVETEGLVDRIDERGRHRIINVSSTLKIRSKVSAKATVIGADGKVKEQSTPPHEDASSVVALADQDEPVARALRIYGSQSPTWASLYHAYEIVEAEQGGERKMLNLGWAAGDEIKRFKQSANSVPAVGDAARHGEVFGAPAKPMSLSEAQALVGTLLNRWLEKRSASRTS